MTGHAKSDREAQDVSQNLFVHIFRLLGMLGQMVQDESRLRGLIADGTLASVDHMPIGKIDTFIAHLPQQNDRVLADDIR